MTKRIIHKEQGYKVYYDNEYREYSVKHPTNHNATSFHSDKEDAIMTMRYCINHNQ